MKIKLWPVHPMVFLVVALAGIVAFMTLLYRISSPQLLVPKAGADWVISPNPANFAANNPRRRLSQFHTVLALPAPPAVAMAQLRSLGQSELYINGRSVARTHASQGRLESASVDLAPYLQSGSNEIVVETRHIWGPAAVLFSSAALDLPARIDWQVSTDGRAWNTAKLAADAVSRPEQMLLSAPDQLRAHSTLLLLLAALGAAAALALHRVTLPQATGEAHLLRAWQWTLMLGLIALHAWNFERLPPYLGMDMIQHVEYVDYILERRSLPFADQGWQLFQPPLPYLIAAMVETLRASVAPGLAPLDMLRLLTLICSLATALAACRICTLAFARAGTAAAAMLVAAFFPASLYMAAAFSNEPFAALFGTLLILESVRLMKGSGVARWAIVRTGVWLGLGLLSKPSVVLLLPAVLVLFAWKGRGRAAWIASWRPVGAILALGFAIAGWWYVRNMLRFGRPFIGGWEAGRGMDWWQYPGYRVPDHWLRFGESLVRPIYSGLDSFWDSVYSTLWLDGFLSGQINMEFGPPWNFSFMVTLALLALPIMAAIAWGALRAGFYPKNELERNLALFASANCIVFLMAMALVYGEIPAYCAGKGTYMLAAAACLPILAGLGIDNIMKRLNGRLVVSAFAAIWLGFVALSFLAR
jgi:hypothetical protein